LGHSYEPTNKEKKKEDIINELINEKIEKWIMAKL
jgi:hypothetical protein